MDGADKAFVGLVGVILVANLAFWGLIAYVIYRVLTHFGIL